jgi:predicted RNase H-like HicB family nuclease
MKDRYIFPAILTYEVKGISIEFPDLPGCLPYADDTDEAIKNAKEALELHLFGMEKDGDAIPDPTDIRDIRLKKDQTIILVEVWMTLVREEMMNKSVNKNLTVPRWLNDIAEKNHINFSQVLQTALKEYLGLVKK